MTPEEIEQQVRAFIKRAKGEAADGLNLAEFSSLATDLLRLAVAAVDSVPVDGVAKKAFVMNSVALLFDGISDRLVPTIMLPFWYLAKPIARQIVLAIASGAIESLLPLVRSSMK